MALSLYDENRYGLSEEFLATWLESRDIDPLDVAVGTKWGYDYTAQWKVVLCIVHVVQRSNCVRKLNQTQTTAKLKENLLMSSWGVAH